MRHLEERGLLAAVALLAATGAGLDLAFTRLITAAFNADLAHLVMLGGMALAGVAGAVAAAAAPPTREAAAARATQVTAVAALLAVLGVIALIHVAAARAGAKAPRETADALALFEGVGRVRAGLVVAGAIAPLVAIGAALGLAMRCARGAHAAATAWGLAGGAVGLVLVAGALPSGGPRSVLVLALVIAFAAVGLVLASGDAGGAGRSLRRRQVVATVLLGNAALLAGDVGAPYLKLKLPDESIESERWSDLALVTVDKASAGVTWLRVDGDREAPLVDKTPPPADPADMAYAMGGKADAPVLVVGAHGGREVRAAWRAGRRSIRVIAVEPDVARALRDEPKALGDATGEVEIGSAGGRDALRGGPWGTILLASDPPDGSAAHARPLAGGLMLAQAELDTVEAWGEALAALAPDGVVVARRDEADLQRALAAATAALRARGAERPEGHVFACVQPKQGAAVLVRAVPLSAGDQRALRKHCKQDKLVEAFAPDRPEPGLPSGALAATDARPLRADDAHHAPDPHPAGLPRARVAALGALAAGLACALLAVVACVIAGRRRRDAVPADGEGAVGIGGRLGAALAATLGGAALGAAQVPFLHAAARALGHPTTTASLAAPAFFAAAALGALGAGGASLERARIAALVRALGTAAIACGVAVAWSPLLGRLGGARPGVRAAVAIALVVGPGALAGGLAALAMRTASLAPRAGGAAWGAWTAGVAAGTAGACLVVADFGFPTALGVATACALAASLVLPSSPSVEA